MSNEKSSSVQDGLLNVQLRQVEITITKSESKEGSNLSHKNKQLRKLNKALLNAVKKGYIDIIELLLNAGADVNHQSKNGKTALIYAVAGGNKAIVQRLLKQNQIKINLADKNKITPFMYAVLNNEVDIAKLLLEGGVDVNCKNNYGDTAFMVALKIATKKHNEDMIKLLLKHQKIQIDSTDKDDLSPLMYAVKQGDIHTAKLLLKGGADVNFQNKDGLTAFIVAIVKRDRELIKFLLNYDKTQVDLIYKDKCTAFLLAVQSRDIEIVRLFLDCPKVDLNFDAKMIKSIAKICKERNEQKDRIDPIDDIIGRAIFKLIYIKSTERKYQQEIYELKKAQAEAKKQLVLKQEEIKKSWRNVNKCFNECLEELDKLLNGPNDLCSEPLLKLQENLKITWRLFITNLKTFKESFPNEQSFNNEKINFLSGKIKDFNHRVSNRVLFEKDHIDLFNKINVFLNMPLETSTSQQLKYLKQRVQEAFTSKDEDFQPLYKRITQKLHQKEKKLFENLTNRIEQIKKLSKDFETITIYSDAEAGDVEIQSKLIELETLRTEIEQLPNYVFKQDLIDKVNLAKDFLEKTIFKTYNRLLASWKIFELPKTTDPSSLAQALIDYLTDLNKKQIEFEARNAEFAERFEDPNQSKAKDNLKDLSNKALNEFKKIIGRIAILLDYSDFENAKSQIEKKLNQLKNIQIYLNEKRAGLNLSAQEQLQNAITLAFKQLDDAIIYTNALKPSLIELKELLDSITYQKLAGTKSKLFDETLQFINTMGNPNSNAKEKNQAANQYEKIMNTIPKLIPGTLDKGKREKIISTIFMILFIIAFLVALSAGIAVFIMTLPISSIPTFAIGLGFASFMTSATSTLTTMGFSAISLTITSLSSSGVSGGLFALWGLFSNKGSEKESISEVTEAEYKQYESIHNKMNNLHSSLKILN